MQYQFEPYKLVEQLIRESRNAESSVPVRAVPEKLRAMPRTVGTAIPMPDASVLRQPLRDFLPQRSSHRLYAASPLNLQDVATTLWFARSEDEKVWPHANAAGNGLQLLLLASRISSLEPMLYWHDHVAHQLWPSAEAPSADEVANRLLLQREFALAPCQVFILGNLAGACESAGSFGHRELLVRVGAAGNNLMLSASSMGLVSCIYAGTIPSELHRLCGVDGYRLRVLLAVAIGYPAPLGTG